MVQEKFWEENLHVFKKCGWCSKYSYVNKNSELRREPGCRGCMAPNCKGNRKAGKGYLLKMLEKKHGAGIYKSYLIEEF